MNKGYNIEDESESLLSSLQKGMPFQVPVAYFDQAPEKMTDLARNIDMDTVSLQGVSKEMPYHVPSEYFINFETELAALLGDETSKQVKTQMPAMKMPEGYFKTLPDTVLGLAKQKEKRVFLFPALQYKVVSRIAAAAVLVLGLGFGMFRIMDRNQPTDATNILSNASHTELTEFAQQYYADAGQDVAINAQDLNALKFDNNDIIQYLNETGWDNVE